METITDFSVFGFNSTILNETSRPSFLIESIAFNPPSKKSLDNLMNTIEISSNGLGLIYNLGKNPFARSQVFL